MIGSINPKVDVAFKKIFGVEENKDLLISLINSIVSDHDQVKDITILNPYNPQNFKNDKLSILDIKAQGESGKRFNIEIQITDSADYDKRALFYWAKLYTEQLKSGEDYSKLNKAIGIHILNFTSIENCKKYHNTFHITEKDTHIHYFKHLELHTIELNKFDNDVQDDFSILLNKMQEKIGIWMAFLTKHELLNSRKDQIPQNIQLRKALDIINVMNFTQEELDAYDEHLKYIRDISSAGSKKFNEGLEQGKAEGETKKTLEIAKLMLSENSDPLFISKVTGLSHQQVLKLKTSN